MSDAKEKETAKRLRLWFFRDLSSDQRAAFCKLMMPDVQEDFTSHYSQREALNWIILDLQETK